MVKANNLLFKILWVIIFVVFFLFESYSQHYLFNLKNEETFNELSGLPLSDKYGQVSAVKIVFDLKSKELYFVNSKYHKFHHEFCSSILYSEMNLEEFNSANYSNSPKRRFLLANINYFKALNTYALEISPVDLMSVAQIKYLHRLVKEKTFINDLKFLTNSYRLNEEAALLGEEIPILDPAFVYSNMNYQAIAKYSNGGILKFVENWELEKDKLSRDDIIIINTTPLSIPNVRGVLITEFQTPLSHITILGKNRRIPISAYKLAFSDSLLRSLEGKMVNYTVNGDFYKINEVDKIARKTWYQKDIEIKYDLTVDSLVSIERISAKSKKFAGNKASNFGDLHKLSTKHEFKVPEGGFVIPFYFYSTHVTNSESNELINRLIKRKISLIDKDSLKIYLKEIRHKILSFKVSEMLLKGVEHRIEKDGKYDRYRFRSSTNAEDTNGFSGAGLYESKTGIIDNVEKSIEDAIRGVWASLWSYDAFIEREIYGIKHEDVFMAILVHRAFPDEGVNGVVISKNLYDDDGYGFVVNSQLGDNSVVAPKENVLCDQFIAYPNNSGLIYEGKNAVDIITFSNLNNGKLVMSEKEIQHLANQIELIKKYFYKHTLTPKSYRDFGLDIEFKLESVNRNLYIKQVRLYND